MTRLIVILSPWKLSCLVEQERLTKNKCCMKAAFLLTLGTFGKELPEKKLSQESLIAKHSAES